MEAAQWVSHTQEVLKKIQEVGSALADLESAQRGFIITGNEHQLDRRQNSKTVLQNSLSDIRKLTSDNPNQQSRLVDLAPLIAQRIEYGDQTLVARRTLGFAAAANMILTNVGVDLTAIQQLLKQMTNEENTLLSVREHQNVATSSRTFLLVPLVVVLSVTILALGLFFLNASTGARLQADVAFNQSKGWLCRAETIAAIGNYHIDLRTDKLTCSDGLASIYGLTPCEIANLTRHDLLNFVHPDDRAGVETWRDAVQGGGRVGHTYRIVRSSGETRDMELHAQLERDSEGAIIGTFGAVQDITERTHEARAVTRLAAIVESSDDAIISKDLNGIVTSWNMGAEKLFTFTATEMIGSSILRLIPVDRHDEETLILGKIKRGEKIEHFETQRQTRDGRLIDVSIAASPIKDLSGMVVGVSKVARDITETKKTQQALRSSENQFRTMANAIPQLVWTARPDGSIFWYNQRWYEYTGTTPEQMEGWGWTRVHDPAMLPQVMERWKASIASGKTFEMEFPLRGNDAKFRWFLTRIVPIKDANGNVEQWFGTNTDISQKREAAEEIKRLNADLERRVIERTAQLEAANKELDAFTYSVSHDLRTPLRTMDGYSQAVLEDFGPQLPAEGQRFLQTIRDGAQRMGALIDDLLSFARLSRSPLNKQPVDMNRLVRDTLEALAFQREDRKLTISVANLPPCEGDANLLKQVWENLLSNAQKYTGKCDHASVEVGFQLEHGKTIYFVRDNGTGFDMQYAGKLFSVFQRLHRTDEYEGTGVGLAIVERIVRRHGGRVWAEAAVGRGATFYFDLDGELKL